MILPSAYSALWCPALLWELLLLLLFPSFPFHSEMNKWFVHAESVHTRPAWWQRPASSAPETAENFFLLRKTGSHIGICTLYWCYFDFLLFSVSLPPLTFITTSLQPQPPPAEILLPTHHFINAMLSGLIFWDAILALHLIAWRALMGILSTVEQRKGFLSGNTNPQH